MGLCKCPNKKVTNLFCFVHRVNVCEHCLVANHSKCVVQSYLRWLQDSDYNPVCTLCNGNLDNEAAGDCVRLMCYDVFHWSCLDRTFEQVQVDSKITAYRCPSCDGGVFPAENVVSPVAEVLREYLSKVNWGRRNLGLEPLPASESDEQSSDDHEVSEYPDDSGLVLNDAMPELVHPTSWTVPQQTVGDHFAAGNMNNVYVHESSNGYQLNDSHQHYNKQAAQAQVPSIRAGMTHMPSQPTENRKYGHNTGGGHITNLAALDYDDNKYKRRSAFHWLQFMKPQQGKRGAPRKWTVKMFMIIFALGALLFVSSIMLLAKYGRATADKDPLLDPMANPNIRWNN